MKTFNKHRPRIKDLRNVHIRANSEWICSPHWGIRHDLVDGTIDAAIKALRWPFLRRWLDTEGRGEAWEEKPLYLQWLQRHDFFEPKAGEAMSMMPIVLPGEWRRGESWPMRRFVGTKTGEPVRWINEDFRKQLVNVIPKSRRDQSGWSLSSHSDMVMQLWDEGNQMIAICACVIY